MGKVYVDEDRSLELAWYVFEAVEKFPPLGEEASQFAFVRLLQDYFEKKRTINDVGVFAQSLLFYLNSTTDVRSWSNKKMIELLWGVYEVSYDKHRADEGNVAAARAVEKAHQQLLHFYREHKHQLVAANTQNPDR